MKKLKQKKNKQNRQTKITTLVKPKLLTLVIAQALTFQAAQAATIEVTSHLDNGTDCTLREAVESVNADGGGIGVNGCYASGVFGNNDTITFASNVSGSTITLGGSDIDIEKSVSINPGGSDTTISGNNSSRIFFSDVSGIEIDLNHLILRDGSSFSGGAISVAGPNNTLTLDHCTVLDNDALVGGGISADSSSVVTITDSTISGNTGAAAGGIFADIATVNLTNSTVSGNTAYNDGGGIFATNSSNLSLTNSTVSGNSARFGGGILADDFSTVNLTSSTVSGNSADDGGGLRAISSTVTLSNSTVSGNSASFNGGGLRVGSSTVNLTNSTVSGNSVGDGGGGIFTKNNSTISVSNSSVVNNKGKLGAGIGLEDSVMKLSNTTVSGNSASDAGGGIIAIASDLELTNSTISSNSASIYSGLFAFMPSTVNLTNSIIADSAAGNDCEGGIVTAGPDSIIEQDACGTNARNVNPGLISLADNGGLTETHALMPGSPAIDGGNNATCEATDQRGEARNDGACDIGAYEFKATVMPIAKKDRKMNSLMSNGEQWYSFNSTESQKLSLQTNGFSGDTILEFYKDNKNITNQLSMDDDSGPELFSNIKQNISSGPYLIRVKGKTAVDPYWLRLMSDRDILSFGDTASHFANKEIRVMSSAGITGGCGVNQYCPTDPVTRAQMAIFMLKAILGGNHSSPPASGTVFSDVSTSSFGASFIEEFSTLGITSGCGGGKYCPDLAVTREQMAVFLLRAWYGSSYTPPAATPAEINQFSDIANSFAKDWIVQLTKENITGGCGGGKYCPTDTVTRGQMAAFIARTFSLDTEL